MIVFEWLLRIKNPRSSKLLLHLYALVILGAGVILGALFRG